uniref:Uncharacterized protein n=1 Tax=Micrurus corallinus TaxID=54390 RepID=A0A2D4FWM0_MICCO
MIVMAYEIQGIVCILCYGSNLNNIQFKNNSKTTWLCGSILVLCKNWLFLSLVSALIVTDLPKCFSSYPVTTLCQEPLVKDFEIKSTTFLGSHLDALKIMLKV